MSIRASGEKMKRKLAICVLNSAQKAQCERPARDDGRLQRHDARDLAASHAQNLVQAELLVAAPHDEVVGVHHEKAHDHAEEHGEPAKRPVEKVGDIRVVDAGDVDLQADGVERVEDGNAEREGQKIDEVVSTGSADVAPGQLKEHRSPHRPSSRRPA